MFKRTGSSKLYEAMKLLHCMIKTGMKPCDCLGRFKIERTVSV